MRSGRAPLPIRAPLPRVQLSSPDITTPVPSDLADATRWAGVLMSLMANSSAISV
jgi:hypothetical protein